MNHKELISSLHHNSKFQDWVKDARSNMPRIPSYDPKDHAYSEATWAYWSGMRDGYQLLASYLGVNLDE